MGMADHLSCRLMDKWALSIADMDGVMRDLDFVADACGILLEKLAARATDLITLESLQSAAMIKYGRCFKTGVRNAFTIPKEWLNELSAELKEAHEDTLTLRDKHLAHAVNDWDNHIPLLWAVRDYPDAAPRLLNVFVGYNGTIGLDPKWIQHLRDVALTLRSRIGKEMDAEREKIIECASKLPIEELERRFRENRGDIPEARNLDDVRRRH